MAGEGERMNLRDIARALAVTTVIADAAKERKDELRAMLVDALGDVGADATSAQLPDGTAIGKASLAGGKPRAHVTNEDTLTAWVADNAPTEVVWRVRDAYRKALLDRLAPGPDGTAVDTTTGEVVPGVTFTTANPYVSMRFAPDGRAAVMDALRSGVIALDITPTPELPTGDPT
jgi:hypothetical protein